MKGEATARREMKELADEAERVGRPDVALVINKYLETKITPGGLIRIAKWVNEQEVKN